MDRLILSPRRSRGGCTATWFVLICSLIVRICSAYDMIHVDVSNSLQYKELATTNILVVDELHAHALDRRQSSSNDSETTSIASTPTLDTSTGLPQPFDTSLGSNFTTSACPDYFAKFLADSTFLLCLPVSLLLQNSMSFFQAARSTTMLQKTLDTSCSASIAVCSPLMDNLASQLISQDNCQDDYLRRNPLVIQAYSGLAAYEPLYQATCLQDRTTGKYNFQEAMESSNADDSYPYYTAVGLQLPTGSKPTCSTGLRQTMEIFAGYAVQKEQPLADSYLQCATQVNAECGPGFASTQVKSISKVASNDAKRIDSNSLLVASLLFMIGILS